MDLNVKVALEVSVKPEVLEVMKGLFGAKGQMVNVVAPAIEVPDEAAKVIEKAIEEEISPKSSRSRSNKATKPKTEEPKAEPEPIPEPVQAPTEASAETPAEELTPEPAEKAVTIEDARAKATALLKADPANRDKVAAALKACGASKLTEITAPEDLKKFVELLEEE